MYKVMSSATLLTVSGNNETAMCAILKRRTVVGEEFVSYVLT